MRMKKGEAIVDDDPLDREIDFSNGVRGLHYEVVQRARNWVFLDPDVLAHFPDSESVNAALRELIAKRE